MENGKRRVEANTLLSEYWRASSATASLILFLTDRSVSDARVSMSFCRMAAAWSLERDMNMSTLSPLSVFRVFDAIRRKITAANDRV
jgi:hypothetical protein